jgi:predicted MFS family arabinose efflux permease
MDTFTNETSALKTPEHNPRPSFLSRLRRLLIHRHFALLWTGQTVSTFGSYITSMGLPMVAWYMLHATTGQMGLLVALGALPGLLLGLFIGVWVDRLPRRPIMLAADLGRALLLVLIPLAAAFGLLHLALFYVVTVLAGLFTVGFEVASLSFLPTLLAPELLAVGNSRLGTSDSLAEIAGPPLAGLLIQLLTAPVAILLDALSFLFSALCVSQIRLPEAPRSASTQRPHLWREMREGLGVLARDPILRALAAYIGTQNFFGGFFAVLYLIYIFELCGANLLAYSMLVACGGIGAVVGSFCASWCVRRFGSGRALIGAALLAGTLSFCTPLATGPAPIVFALMALSQLIGDTGFAVYSINEISLRQRLVPGHLLGRVNACMHILSTGIMPLGALLAGAVSEMIGIRLTLLIGASGLFLACAWLLFSPLRHYK